MNWNIIMHFMVAIMVMFFIVTPTILTIILYMKSLAKGPNPAISRLEEMDQTIANDTNAALDIISQKLEDMDSRIAEVENDRIKVEGFKGKKR